ncbi:MAG: homocysteine S-methyltransferase family protein [Chloroflexi bacterium]|nr:homocysteine S-methyltransferase family protein [Chloroflexota bacterium]MCL5273164.1 homocysteine S-methyltransferase family protein [Chloroflexota bacterium]
MRLDLLILDGAMGTELARRGVDTGLPLWSANALLHAQDVVRQIHLDYLMAGARIITTDTFRTNLRTLERAGLRNRMRELTFMAVELARQAAASANRRDVLIAGSIAPVEDCYSPDLVPRDESVLLAEHTALAQQLAEAGCDVLLLETMNTVREAAAAARAAAQTGLPVWVSFMLGHDNRLLGGESLHDAVAAVLPYRPQAVLLNCLPVAQVSGALALLQAEVGAASGIRIGVYANAGHVGEQGWSMEGGVNPQDYAAAAIEWQAAGASIIGGCCGTTPQHIRAVAERLHAITPRNF